MNQFLKRWLQTLLVFTGLTGWDSPIQAKSIPIIVDCPYPDPRPSAPVKFGVPFPRGELKTNDVANIRVFDGDNNVVPHQSLVTATWNPTGSDGVRWLLIDLLVDKGKSYTLRFNEPKPPPAVELLPVAVLLTNNNQIAIDTGPIKGQVATKGGDHFGGLTVMGAPLAVKPEGDGPLAFNGFYVEHETKGIFRADLDRNATVVIEETGPIRATLKADGWYANAAGEKFCRYSVRFHFFRGRQDIKLEHTFIFTGLSAADRLHSVSLQLRRVAANDGKNLRVYFGGEDLLVPSAVADAGGAGYVLQDQSERGRYDFVFSSGDGKTTMKFADRGGGWMTILGDRGAMVAIRDAWQQFPWELEIEQGAMRVHFWPRHGRLFDTTWDGCWHFLTERQKRFLAEKKPHKESDLDAWIARLRKATNATGAAKTHEVWVSFVGPNYGAFQSVMHPVQGNLAREAAYPVLAHADLQWTCATRALDFLPHWPKDMRLFPDEENHLQAMFRMVQDAIAANDWHGWWDWGGYHQHLWVGPQMPRNGAYVDDAGLGHWHRAHPKSHYGWGGLLWVQFMRTGQRDWLRYAQTYTLYSADRAHTHHTGHGRVAGAEFHYDNSEVHWLGGYQREPGGDQIASNLQGKDDYVYQFWLTGDRRPLDVLKSWGEQALAANDEGAKWGVWKPGFSVGNDIRNAGMQLHRVMLLYQTTWDVRYLDLAEQIAAAFVPLDTEEKVAAAEDDGHGGKFHQAAGWAYEGMWFFWNVTKNEAFRIAFLRFIERSRHHDAGFLAGYGAIRAFTYGYHLTGDAMYLDLARAACDSMIADGMSPWVFLPGGKMNINPVPRFLGTMATAPKAWRDANLPTHERGRKLTFRYATWNNNPYLAGTRAFFREDKDREWSFDGTFNYGGRIVVRRPDGKIGAEQDIDHKKNKLARFVVPKDELMGVYTLECVEPSEEFRQNTRLDYQALARVIRADLPMVVQAAERDQSNPVVGRALFFGVAAKTMGAAVTLGAFDRKRECLVRQVGDGWQANARAAIPNANGSVNISIPEADSNRVFGLIFASMPDAYFDPERSRPKLIFLQNAPPYFAANPEQYFVPAAP